MSDEKNIYENPPTEEELNSVSTDLGTEQVQNATNDPDRPNKHDPAAEAYYGTHTPDGRATAETLPPGKKTEDGKPIASGSDLEENQNKLKQLDSLQREFGKDIDPDVIDPNIRDRPDKEEIRAGERENDGEPPAGQTIRK